MFSSSICNVAEELLNFVAETTDCKQFISYTLIQKVTHNKMIHNKKQSFFLELVHLLQNTDVLTAKMQQDLKSQSNCSHQDINDSS